MQKSFAAADKLQTATFRLKTKERVNASYEGTDMYVKLRLQPHTIYLKIISPDKDMEILWEKGKNKGEAKVHLNSFPYLTLNLDPQGSLMMKNKHHQIAHLGFAHLNSVLKKNIAIQGAQVFYKNSTVSNAVFDGKACYKLEIINDSYSRRPYRAQVGETLNSISEKFGLPVFTVLLLNPSYGSSDNITGQNVWIPTGYAQKLILYFSQENHLPLAQYIFDDKGPYEQYEFFDFKLNPPIRAIEFTAEGPGYKF